MLELSPNQFIAAIAAIGFLLYLFLWRVTKDLPLAAKVMARFAFAAVAIVPFVLSTFFGGSMPKSSAPPMAEQKRQQDQASGGAPTDIQRRGYGAPAEGGGYAAADTTADARPGTGQAVCRTTAAASASRGPESGDAICAPGWFGCTRPCSSAKRGLRYRAGVLRH